MPTTGDRRKFLTHIAAGLALVGTTACLGEGENDAPAEGRLEFTRTSRCRGEASGALFREDEAWRMPYHDAANTNHNPVSGLKESPTEQWQYGEDGGFTYPAVVDDAVYVGRRSDASAVAVDAVTGDELWRRDLAAGRVSPPVVSDEAVFHVVGETPAMDSDRTGCVLYRLDRDTGEVDWQHETELPGSPVPVIGENHVYYTAGSMEADRSSSSIFAVDRATGEEAWQRGGQGLLFDQYGAAVTDRAVYVAGRGRSGRDEIWAFDTQDGTDVWQGGDSGAVSSAPLVARNGVLHANDRGYCASDGSKAFSVQIHGDVGTFVGALAVTDESVFIRTTSGSGYPPDTVFRVDPGGGDSANYGLQEAEEIVSTRDVLYVSEGYEPVRIHALATESTDRLWTTELDGTVIGFAATKEQLTVATDTGLIHLA